MDTADMHDYIDMCDTLAEARRAGDETRTANLTRTLAAAVEFFTKTCAPYPYHARTAATLAESFADAQEVPFDA